MIASAVVVGVISLSISYRQAFKEQEARLTDIVQSRARMIEAVASFDSQYSSDFPGGPIAATLIQIRKAHQDFKGFGQTGEFTLANLDSDQINFLLRQRHGQFSLENASPVPWVSRLAEPMRRALQGQSGVMTGLDYAGVEVLAAYEPIAVLELGMVAKIDVAEIRAPFIQAGIISALGGFFVILLGGFLFLRISEPYTREIKQANQKLESEALERKTQEKALAFSREQYEVLLSQVSKAIAGVSKKTGEQFFVSLVRSLSASLGFSFVVIAEVQAENPERMSTLAVGNDKQMSANFTFDIQGTPCENLLKRRDCFYSEKVAELYPLDTWLRDNKIESYIGVLLLNSAWDILGVLIACHDAPKKNLTHPRLIFPFFSAMAEAEMERRRYEKAFLKENALVRLSKSIAVASNDLPDMESILRFSLRKICEYIKWPVGHFYRVDNSVKELIPVPIWYLEDPERFAHFRSATESFIFEKGAGLPGRILQEGGAAWIPDLWNDPNFPRSQVAREVGLRTGMAFPIMVGNNIEGVLEFYTDESLLSDPDLMEKLAPLGVQLGRVLERVKSENLLKKQAQVLDQIHDAVISIDGKFNMTSWNKGAERVFGFVEEEMLGKPFACIFPDEDEILKQILIQPAIINHRYEKEMKAIKKSGDHIYINVSLSALCDDNCTPQSIICYALDITEKKHARDQLQSYSKDLEKRVQQRTAELNVSVEKTKESVNQVEGILRSIEEGLLVADDHGKLVLMNPSAEKILGIKKEEVLGKYVSQVLENQSLLECWDIKETEKSSARSFGFELTGKGEEQGNKFARGASTLLLGENDEDLGTVVVITDITYERKVDQLKSQFLSTAAHELRTPLTSLLGFSEILLNKQDLGKEQEVKYLRYINEESLKLATIINDFLDISRIESGKGISLNKMDYSVRDTIERSMHIFDEQINTRHKFEFDYPAESLNWKIDQDKMEQVLKNIYSNAIKYSPKGGKVATTVRKVKDSIEIAIADEGMGMTAKQLNQIFERFYRGDDFGIEIPGSGLGMTIVKYILEAHGGKIGVKSEPDKGTRVVISVPCDIK